MSESQAAAKPPVAELSIEPAAHVGVSKRMVHLATGVITVVALVILAVVLFVTLRDGSAGATTQCKCVVYEDEVATLTSEITRTKGTNVDTTVNPDGPEIGGELTMETVDQDGITLSVAVAGNIDCAADRSSCLTAYERKCSGIVPYPGAGDDCGENGIYETKGEPPEADYDSTLTESCWDLSSYGGAVKASGVETIFRNENYAGLVAANPTLESMCGENVDPKVLQTGVVVCLNPQTENKCHVEQA